MIILKIVLIMPFHLFILIFLSLTFYTNLVYIFFTADSLKGLQATSKTTLQMNKIKGRVQI